MPMGINSAVGHYQTALPLTTKGDLVKRGVAIPERFPVGTTGEVLGVNQMGDDLIYQPPNAFNYGLEYSDKNAADVTLDPGGVTILDLAIPNSFTGTRYQIFGHVYFLNSGVLTGVRVELLKGAGTATIVFLHDLTVLMCPGECANNQSFYANVTTHMKIMASGTCTLRVRGFGSNTCVVSAGNCQLYARMSKQPSG